MKTPTALQTCVARVALLFLVASVAAFALQKSTPEVAVLTADQAASFRGGVCWDDGNSPCFSYTPTCEDIPKNTSPCPDGQYQNSPFFLKVTQTVNTGGATNEYYDTIYCYLLYSCTLEDLGTRTYCIKGTYKNGVLRQDEYIAMGFCPGS